MNRPTGQVEATLRTRQESDALCDGIRQEVGPIRVRRPGLKLRRPRGRLCGTRSLIPRLGLLSHPADARGLGPPVVELVLRTTCGSLAVRRTRDTQLRLPTQHSASQAVHRAPCNRTRLSTPLGEAEDPGLELRKLRKSGSRAPEPLPH